MAGKIIVDTIDTDNAFITLNVQQSLIATMNVSGIFSNTGVKMIGANGTVSNTAITGLVTASQIATVANTQITGNITSSQITSNPTLYGNVSVTGVIGVGGATTSTSGSGISFPATQSASSDANTLDDYEEGSWTPTLGGNTTYSSQEGKYTRIGNFVYVTGIIVVTTLGTGSTTTISGLPFTSFTQANRHAGSIAYYSDIAANTITLYIFNNNNSTTLQFSTVAVSTTGVDDTKAIFGNSTHVQFSLSYRAA